MSFSDTLRKAVAAFQTGDFHTARVQGEAALRSRPKDLNALQFMGVVAAQSGNAQAGAAYFKQAIDAGGDTVDNRINLAKALAETGDLTSALAICAPQAGKPSPQLDRMHADLLKLSGRSTEAVWTYERLVQENPNDFDCWNNLGNARHEMGDLEGALSAYQQARGLNAESTLVHTNLGRVLISLDRHEDACLMLEKAALLEPENPAPLLELGHALISIDHADAGLRALGTAARIDPTNPKVFIAIGLAFTDLQEPLQAERAYRFAIQADPKHAQGYLDLGIMLEKANRLDDLRDIVTLAKNNGLYGDEISYLEALLSSRDGQTETALNLLRSIRSTAIHPATRAQFIGQLEDRLGNFDRAFLAYEDMNNIMARSPLGVGIDRSAYQRDLDRLAQQTTAESYAQWPAVVADDNRAVPAFLVGFPRSGTTLMDTLLMGHSQMHVLEEIPIIENLSKDLGGAIGLAELSAADVRSLRARYFSELDRISPPSAGALVIDKNPLSMIHIPLIHRLFPDAKIILALRHPCDVVLSCYMQNFKPTEAMSSFLDVANAGRTYDSIFAYWEKCRSIYPLSVHSLRYEDMIADVEAEMRTLITFLELDWEAGIMDHQKTAKARGFIRTPSYAQVTQGIYSTSSGRWTNYRDHLSDALPNLEHWAVRYGYSVN